MYSTMAYNSDGNYYIGVSIVNMDAHAVLNKGVSIYSSVLLNDAVFASRITCISIFDFV